MKEGKPPWITRLLLAVFLISFFGGGVILIVNLFFPFLGEAAFPIIALVVMAELLVLLVVGKCVQTASGLRRLRNAALAVPLDQSPMTTRIKCTRCDRMILEATAERNGGLCEPCAIDERKRVMEVTIQGWMRHPETLPGTNGIPEPEDFALRMYASHLREAKTPEGQMESVCHAFFEKALNKWAEHGAATLSEKEKHVLSVETFYGEVLCGGLLQYLDNQPAFANWAAGGFDRIGMPEYAAVMRRVMALFPNGTISEDEECSDIVDGLEGLLEQIEEGFWSRLRTDGDEIRRNLYAYITG
jgi:hypothetical protein